MLHDKKNKKTIGDTNLDIHILQLKLASKEWGKNVDLIYRVIVGCPAILLLPLKLRGGDVVLFGSPFAYSFGISGSGQFKIDGFGAAAWTDIPFGPEMGGIRTPKLRGSNLPP